MNTYFIGQLKVVKPGNRKDKATGQINSFTQVTVSFEAEGKDGFPIMAMTDFQFDVQKLGELTQMVGKYIVIPHLTISTPKGTYTFMDDNLEYKLFDTNPFDVAKAKVKS